MQENDYFGEGDDVPVINAKEAAPDEIRSHVVGGMLVDTPIDQVIEDFSDIIAEGINRTLHPGLNF